MSPRPSPAPSSSLERRARARVELFLVDGNNLAYRAFFALPEELATSEGLPTNALLGFTNMLFKLLSDYRPKGVAVAWDTRPVAPHRGRRGGRGRLQGGPPADAGPAPRAVPALPADRRGVRLPEPRVRGLGGRRRDRDARDPRRRGGIKTCVVSTDRDAFQLVSENVCADDDAARRRATSTSTRRSASRRGTASGPTRCPTSSASRATPPTTSRASRASATRPPGS